MRSKAKDPGRNASKPIAANPQLTEEAREFLRKPATEVPKETVFIPGGAVTITESAEKLFKTIGPKKELFYRGGVVVELKREGATIETEILSPVAAQSRFEKYATF